MQCGTDAMRSLFLTDHYPEEKGIFSDLYSRTVYCPLISQGEVRAAISLAELRGDNISDAVLYPGPRNGAIIKQDGEGFDYPISYEPEMIYGAGYGTY